MGRFPKWISSSGNEAVLQHCLQIVQAYERYRGPNDTASFAAAGGSVAKETALSDQCANPQLEPLTDTQVILLSGDSGCGMSALTHQLSRRLSRQGIGVVDMPDAPTQPLPTFTDGLVDALGLPPHLKSSNKVEIEVVCGATYKLRQIQVTIVNDVQSYMRRPIKNVSSAINSIAGFIRSSVSKFVFLCGTTQVCDTLGEGLKISEIPYSKLHIQRMPFGVLYIRFITDTIRALTGISDIPPSLPLELHELSDGLVGLTMKHIRCLVGPTTKLSKPKPQQSQNWFHGYCRPVNDETYSSWVMRNVLARDVLSISGDGLEGCRRMARSISGADMDQASTLIAPGTISLGKTTSDTLAPPFSHIPTLAETFQLTSIVGFSSHSLITYCPQCLAEDVAGGRLPAWRKVWHQYGYCVCNRHEVPVMLSVLQHPSPDPFFKAWEAFCEYVQSPLLTLKRQLVSGALSNEKLAMRERRVMGLIQRVQRWMIGRVLTGCCAELSAEGARFLLNVLLYEPIQNQGPGGFARLYFHKRDLYHVSFVTQRNPGDFENYYLTASPRQTLTAFLMIGIAYGIVTDQESSFLRNVFGAARGAFPNNRHEISFAAASVFLPEHWLEIKSAARSGLSTAEQCQVDWIFEFKPRRRWV